MGRLFLDQFGVGHVDEVHGLPHLPRGLRSIEQLPDFSKPVSQMDRFAPFPVTAEAAEKSRQP
jgi:hypothetical protein